MSELRLKPVESEINIDSPWIDDKLDRKKCADTLTNLITDMPESLVLSVNGCWGSGKTFMLKRWQTDLKNKGFSALYFSAWEDDYQNDPLIAILGQLRKHIGKKRLESVTNYAMPLLKAGANIILKSATSGIIDIEGLEPQKDVFDKYDDAKENLKKLKEGLVEVIQQIAGVEGKILPLVFIIDELDRCRPTFAITLLERIKHIFDIPNVIFVLGIDREQLGHSIKCVYGQDMDIEGYLHRFIDMNFVLPEASTKLFCEHLLSHFGVKLFLSTREKKRKEDYEYFEEFFPTLCHGFKLSLREVEHGIRLFVLASKNTPKNKKLYPILLAVLIILKLKREELYIEYTTTSCLSAKVLDFIYATIPCDSFDEYGYNVLEAHVYGTDINGRANFTNEQLELLSNKKTLTKPEYLSKRTKSLNSENLKHLFDCYKHINIFGNSITKGTLGYLTEKIELASLFLRQD